MTSWDVCSSCLFHGCTEATSEILGGPEKYMTVGSSLRLVCVLRDNTQPPNYVFWYHDEEMINYHSTRGVGPLVRTVADSKFLDGHRSDVQ